MSEIIKVPDAATTDLPRGGPGKKRLVRLIPTPFGSRPAVWTSTYQFPGDDGEPHRNVLVLLSEGGVAPNGKVSPPEVANMRVPSAFLKTLPEIPLEW